MSSAPDAVTVMPLQTDEDVEHVREQLVAMGFSLIEQTKMITAASELARNTLRYGGGGSAHIVKRQDVGKRGVELRFVDEGPGIADLALALTDGYTSGGGLGLGLSGAKRLSDEFTINTTAGKGTTVTITKWMLF